MLTRLVGSIKHIQPNSSLFFVRTLKSCGIVGLPNIGKSTLFNALTKTQLAEAENYPFCTIEPNKANILFKLNNVFFIYNKSF